jgi:hypothetical protein
MAVYDDSSNQLDEKASTATEILIGSPVGIGLKSLKSGTREQKFVVDQLLANLDNDPLSDLSDNAVLITTNMTLKNANSLIIRDNLPFKVFFDSETKYLFACELNGNDQREIISLAIGAQLYIYCKTHEVGNRLIAGHGKNLFGQRVINPDQGLQLRPAPQVKNALMYRLIVQVGFSESLRSLHGHAANFLSPNTGIQVYLYVKIWKKRADGTRAIVAVVYYRNQAHTITFLSCGDAPLYPSFSQFYSQLFPRVHIQQNADQFILNIPGNIIDPSIDPAYPDLQLPLNDLCESISSFE